MTSCDSTQQGCVCASSNYKINQRNFCKKEKVQQNFTQCRTTDHNVQAKIKSN